MDSYEEHFINDLHSGLGKVAISGIIIEKNEGIIVIDDGSGTISVLLNELVLPPAEYLRIFGIIIPGEQGMLLQADVLQDLSTMDRIAHKKVKEKMRNL